MSRATTASGRLAVVLGPREVAALARARGSAKQTDYARVLIQRLVGSSGHVRDLLVAHPAPPLPLDRRQRTRLDVRMPLEQRDGFDRWCGDVLGAADAFRAALHLEADGRLGGQERIVEAPPPPRGARRPARPPQPVPQAAPVPPQDQRSPRPAPRARSRGVRARVEADRGRPASVVLSPHEQALHEVAARVRRRRESDPFYDPGLDAAFGPATTVVVRAGDSDDTEAMIADLTDDPRAFLLARAWSNDVEVEVARALADRPNGAELRLLVGAANDPKQGPVAVGVPDAGAVAERIAGLARLINRPGRIEVTTHWIANDEPCWIVEVEASLR